MPDEFVYITDIIPQISIDLRYHSNKNFMGRKIEGYHSNKAIATKDAVTALKKVQDELQPMGMSLQIFDAYRPQQAVNHFFNWAKDLSDTLNKSQYYPKVPKSELFERGYIAERSGHTRGSTFDLTIINRDTGEELDMGTPWDFFGVKSWPNDSSIMPAQKEHRQLLRQVMVTHGFKPYDREWWHFTLENEPFPETYFDFPVE